MYRSPSLFQNPQLNAWILAVNPYSTRALPPRLCSQRAGLTPRRAIHFTLAVPTPLTPRSRHPSFGCCWFDGSVKALAALSNGRLGFRRSSLAPDDFCFGPLCASSGLLVRCHNPSLPCSLASLFLFFLFFRATCL